MELIDQVLSLSQLSELYKLGFDIVDKSSMCWIKHPDNDKMGLTIFNKELYDKKEIECIPTLSIGDIIDILPNELNINTKYHNGIYTLLLNNKEVYYSNESNYYVFFTEDKLIDTLYETLIFIITYF
ncbi:MAG: hypothetical protein M0R46_15275 [Candidatus Muirbacterium halophilum]|nr:hypothetical protein [Candidatus Muirbacterium halophilum]